MTTSQTVVSWSWLTELTGFIFLPTLHSVTLLWKLNLQQQHCLHQDNGQLLPIMAFLPSEQWFASITLGIGASMFQ